MTNDAFIEKARSVHGDTYDYSSTTYAGSREKLTIVCRHHGPFEQVAFSHLKGSGCPKCGREKFKQTMLARYGVENTMQSADLLDKSRSTKQASFGCLKPPGSGRRKFTRDEFIEKAQAVHGDRYDYSKVNYTGSTSKVVIVCPEHGEFEQVANKHLQGCGCPHVSCVTKKRLGEKVLAQVEQTPVVIQPELESVPKRRSRESFVPDGTEMTRLCDMLRKHFGANDVVFHGSHGFYVQSRDLYVDFQPDDACLNIARSSNLNYVAFTDVQLRDIELWLACGAPDGHDWDAAYSWLPERNFKPVSRPLGPTQQKLSQVAKFYQFYVFFAREIAMWNENPMFRGLPVQIFLYHNRLTYLNKTPDQLSDIEILRGFTISGVLKGYTVFNTELMDQVVQKYDIKSIYDPCAGWGERMLYCFTHDVNYLGVDINENLIPGYEQMQKDFDIKNQKFVCADSANYSPKLNVGFNAHVILTCPPYGSIEHYSDAGAENFSEDVFLTWWKLVISNSLQANPEYFCFQINQKYKKSMSEVVESFGFVLIDEFTYSHKQSSHFTRGRDGSDHKKEYESMLVFRR